MKIILIIILVVALIAVITYDGTYTAYPGLYDEENYVPNVCNGLTVVLGDISQLATDGTADGHCFGNVKPLPEVQPAKVSLGGKRIFFRL